MTKVNQQQLERAIAEKRYCRCCRDAGMIHCAHPEHCGMLDGIKSRTLLGDSQP